MGHNTNFSLVTRAPSHHDGARAVRALGSIVGFDDSIRRWSGRDRSACSRVVVANEAGMRARSDVTAMDRRSTQVVVTRTRLLV